MREARDGRWCDKGGSRFAEKDHRFSCQDCDHDICSICVAGLTCMAVDMATGPEESEAGDASKRPAAEKSTPTKGKGKKKDIK